MKRRRRILITGAQGLAGRHLSARLTELGHQVWGLCRRREGGTTLTWRPILGDVRRATDVRRALRLARPDDIYHLASIISEPEILRDPAAAVDINLGGTIKLLEEVVARSPESRVLIAGSSAVYAPSRSPLSEKSDLEPVSFYGVTKKAQEEAALWFRRRHRLNLWVARTFNHVGPGQAPGLVCSALARQVALAERGRIPPVLRVGNVRPVRDFLDTRDVIEAYHRILERGPEEPVLNVCSGRGVSIASVVQSLLGLARVRLSWKSDVRRKRAQEVLFHVGDNRLLRRRCRWTPSVPWTETLQRLLEDWRRRV